MGAVGGRPQLNSTMNNMAAARRLSAPGMATASMDAGGGQNTKRKSVYYVMRRRQKPKPPAARAEEGGDSVECERRETHESPEAKEIVVGGDGPVADQCSEPIRTETAPSLALSREGHIYNDNTLKTLMKKGLLPEDKACTVDMDRLEEEAEDFTTADWNRLAIHPRKLQPLSVGRKGVILRTIVGERQTFAQGKKLIEKKAQGDSRISTSQSIQQNRARRTTKKFSVSPDKML